MPGRWFAPESVCEKVVPAALEQIVIHQHHDDKNHGGGNLSLLWKKNELPCQENPLLDSCPSCVDLNAPSTIEGLEILLDAGFAQNVHDDTNGCSLVRVFCDKGAMRAVLILLCRAHTNLSRDGPACLQVAARLLRPDLIAFMMDRYARF